MRDIEFVPKHNWFSIIMWAILFTLLGATFSFGGIVIQNWFLTVFGFGIMLVGVFSVISRSTKIVIRDKEVIVKRLLLSRLSFRYENYSGFLGNTFSFGVRGIVLKDITNSQEFILLFSRILNELNIYPTSKHNADISRANIVVGRSLVPLVVISFIFTYILKRYVGIQVDAEVVIAITLLLLCFIVMFVLIRKNRIY